jgi:hypothetical protein
MAHKLVSITKMALVLVLVLALPVTAGAASLQAKGAAAKHPASNWVSPSWLDLLLARIFPGKAAGRSTATPGDAVDPSGTTSVQSSCQIPLFPISGTTNQGSACDPNG